MRLFLTMNDFIGETADSLGRFTQTNDHTNQIMATARIGHVQAELPDQDCHWKPF